MVIYVIFWQNYYFFQNIQVNRLDFNALKCWQTFHYIELSEYKLYMGHIHTLVLTREWIAMLDHDRICFSPLSLVLAICHELYCHKVIFSRNYRCFPINSNPKIKLYLSSILYWRCLN